MPRKRKIDLITKKIDKAILEEEQAVPIYTMHLETALFWAGLSAEKKKEITEKLGLLRRQSEGHVRLLQKVRELCS